MRLRVLIFTAALLAAPLLLAGRAEAANPQTAGLQVALRAYGLGRIRRPAAEPRAGAPPCRAAGAAAQARGRRLTDGGPRVARVLGGPLPPRCEAREGARLDGVRVQPEPDVEDRRLGSDAD